MVEEGRYCVDILQQVSATVQALNGVSKRVLRNYLETCATEAIRSGDAALAKRVYEEMPTGRMAASWARHDPLRRR
jgi:DNA-binding FrmR family transcriptional regulator